MAALGYGEFCVFGENFGLINEDVVALSTNRDLFLAVEVGNGLFGILTAQSQVKGVVGFVEFILQDFELMIL